MPKIKVLCMGSCKGRLADYFDKVRSLHAKHHFELLIISGDLFSPSDPLTEEPEQADGLRALLDGEIDVPLSTYFSIGKTPLPASVQQRVDANQGEVCPNLFYLGQS
ncbi:uncharacterized protein L969DRAFT_86349 [Mixia osmundae IAM 14324]|uniref:uncharacterized protein n=1 Tax=Mixia osmundae (strain CBS 9802 / IAM 14324 / JCM 22182 / KY 12970) TaxID=764103 RepID=UPI0004A5486E|nr:uncharacterized protein L969DRAFT_86349 [Mixia osmundae IAM 14324]KEI41105.1 hypothetical protein L969DRAFT_86349 [Mixia osmundae IAM 14324]